jgi:hypothetical protein
MSESYFFNQSPRQFEESNWFWVRDSLVDRAYLHYLPRPHPVRLSEAEQFILAAVANLREPPEICEGGEDNDYDDQVLLNDKWLSLAQVRETLLSHENIMKYLFDRGVPLEWLEYPEGRSGPTELPPDQAQVDDALYELARRAFNLAESLAIRVHEGVEEPLILTEHDVHTALTEGILRTLGGVAQSIRSSMPRPLRRRGKAIFIIEAILEGYWEADPKRLHLPALFVNEGQLVGGLSDAVAAKLARLVWDDLVLSEDNVLPGFTVCDREPNMVRLLWQRPVIGIRS